MSVQKYSTNADSNTSVGDGAQSVSIAEGMARGDVNNAMRAMAADIAKHYKDCGELVSTGAGDALEITTFSDITALAAGLHFTFKIHTTIEAGATLNLNGIGARAIHLNTPSGLAAMEANIFPTGSFVQVVYDGAQWVCVNGSSRVYVDLSLASAERASLEADNAEAARIGSESAESNSEAARDLAETYAGVNHRSVSWLALSAISGTAGDIGYVGPEDSGVHTDPVVGGSVDNEGVYEWAANGLGSAQAERIASTGLAGFGQKIDDPQREIWGVFFYDPHYEQDGQDLYVKPSPYNGGPNVAYIRGGYLPDRSFTYADILADLAAMAVPAASAVGVTSPSGVTDCIKLGGFTTLYYDVASASWGWASRASQQSGRVKVIENNGDMVAPSSERPEALFKIAKTEIAKTKTEHLTPIITPNSSAGVPNIDTTSDTFTIFADTIFMVSGVPYIVASTTVVDLTAVASSTKVIWLDTRTLLPVLKDYNDGLTEVEKQFFILVCVIRYSSGSYAHAAISCPYTVNGTAPSALSYLDWAAVFTPLTGVTATQNLPNYDTAANTFTLFPDTILSHGNAEWIVSATTTVSMTASSANKVFWDKATNTLQVRAWNANLAQAEQSSFVLVAAIRDPDAANSTITSTVSMLCPYTVNGKLLGYDFDSAVENRAGAAIEGIWHRGVSGSAPENTLAAYRLAAELKGYCVEGDIQWSADGVPVLIHDSTVNRTTNGTGTVVSKTLAQLQALDAGSWKSAAYAGEQIPTFEAFLRLAKKLDLYCYMEIKVSATASQVQGLIALVKKTGMVGRIEFDSFRIADLQKVVAEDATQRVGLLGSMSSAHITSAATLKTASNRVTVAVSHTTVNQSLMDEARTEGLEVVVWTVNSSADVLAVAAFGVDGIMSDTQNIASVLRASEI